MSFPAARTTKRTRNSQDFPTSWGKSARRARRAEAFGEGGWTRRPDLSINRPLAPAFRPRGYAQVAQLVEHATENRSVGGSIPPLGTITALLCAGVRSRSLDSQRSLSSRTFKSSPEFAPAIQLGRFRPATRPAQPYDSGLEYWLAFDFPRQKLLSPAAYDPLLWWASRKSPRRPMRPDFPRPRSLSKRPLGWTMPLWTSDLRSDGVGAGRSLKAGRAVIKYPRSLEIHAAINLRLGRSVKSLFGGPVESP